ncbi:MAG: DUF4115 domain-containing protein [Gaiellaceae bacterium]
MPDTPLDWILALGTLLTAAAVAVMVATNWEAFSASAAAVAVPVPVTVETGTSAPAAFDQPKPPPRREAPVKTAPAPAGTAPAAKPALVITAARGTSWLEVRAGGSTGKELYYGMLEEGTTTELERLPVWVRLGAAESVDVSLGGSRIRSLPLSDNGVVQFVASAEGVTAASPG